jgi:hypothetical protein
MRIRFPVEYVDFSPLYPEHTLLYPRDRSCFLLVTMAQHKQKGHRLVWFFYEPSSGRFYRWTYPQSRYSDGSYWYVQDVIDDLKNISEWDDYRFLSSSRTLDDQNFWTEYVLKKQNGRYAWLEAID